MPQTTADLLERVQAALSASYIIERELSGGAMSRVFVGVETALDRRVVVKVLVADRSTDRDTPGFLREAVLAARLSHPHIVPVFAVGTVAGMPYYTMPFIEGESLRDHLDRVGAMSVSATTRVMREIGSALTAAHELGIIHRDVKPDNIVLERGTGRALLGDFGIAAAPGQSTTVASDGTTLGTPLYMSPEQVDGLELDGRTDIYSLGLVAWEMLVGRRPWKGESLYDVMYCQKHDPLPALDACGIGVPASLARAIEGALQKDRDDRWPSAQHLLAAIDDGSASAPEIVDQAYSSRSSARLDRPWSGERSRDAISDDEAMTSGPRDPALVPTIVMPVRQELRWIAGSTPDAEDWRRSHRAPRRTPISEPVARRLRWVVAAGGAIVVTAGLVAAAASNHGIVRWALSGGDVDTASRPATSSASGSASGSASSSTPATPNGAITRVSAVDAAAGLMPAPSLHPNLAAHDTLPRAPLTQLAVLHEPPPARPLAHTPRATLSPSDGVRARAATATLALEAYERVMAEQRALDAAHRSSGSPR